MVKNRDFLGSVDSDPYNLKHYKLINFAMYVNGKEIPNECLSSNFGHEKTSVMAYFQGNWFTSFQRKQSDYTRYVHKGYFMLLFDLTTDHVAYEGHVSPASNGHIRLELKLAEALPEAPTCLL
jgi:hypothetical protein